MPSSEDNKQIVRRAFDALTSGDLSPLADLLLPDAHLHQCGFLEPIPAGALVRGEFPGASRLSDRQVHLKCIIGEGDLIALHWSTSGRFSDPDSPVLDGQPVSFPSMTFVRLEGGKIAEIWNIQDRATLETQLYQLAEASGSR